MKKILCGILAVLMVVSSAAILASCGEDNNGQPDVTTTTAPADTTPAEREVVKFEGNFTYLDSVSTMATNWNPHTYQTTDDSYPADFLRTGLYTFVFNDEINAVEGKAPYAGYKIIPEMAASEPVDVTKDVKAAHPEFGIPEAAEKGYAYTIDLNPLACWEDGTPINADTYVYSMKQLLDPALMNYRASDYYAGSFCVAGAEFYACQGQSKTISFATVCENEGLAKDAQLESFLAKHGEEKGWINFANSFGFGYDFENYPWDGTFNEAAMIEAEEDIVETPLTVNELVAFYLQACTWADEATMYEWMYDECFMNWTYPSDVDYATVGLYKTGDYQITLVLGKSLAGFNLLYNLSGNWIVKEDLYEANKKQVGDAWTSTYNTDVETTSSFGPYKLVSYQKDKEMRFERNEKWYGYTDGKHIYVDPVDGLTYPMYQTTAIKTTVVADASTRKLMFLKGELMGYGLQSDDFEEYRNSDYVHATPSETIFFLIFNGHAAAIESREANEGFDTTKNDLQTMTLTSFRQAVAVTYDKELFASTISPARSGGYGLIGSAYIYDPETGARYRDTDQAKKALCEFYSVDVDKYESLDEAVDSITGYDPETAKVLYKQAFDEAMEKGFITDADNDGVCDQTIEIEYASSATSPFIQKTIQYLTDKMAEVTEGTPFAGKVIFKESAPYGNEWSNKIRGGMSDTVLGGWSGSALDPFGLSDLYVNPSYQYDAAWFNASTVELTLDVDVAGIDAAAPEVKTVTMSLKQWSDALNGATVEIASGDSAGSYNFGDGIAKVDTRLDILSAIEAKVLSTYDYIPMLQDGSMALLSQQVYYVVEEYNPIMGRGGITYLKYNYNDEEWAAYVAEQPEGQLKY